MINKRSLWFLTLFSFILILSVYYVTMPSELLIDSKETKDSSLEKVTIKESDVLSALRIEIEEERSTKMTELKTILTKANSIVDEKNEAYEALRTINMLKGKEELLESKIKTQYKLSSFIKIEDNQVSVTVHSKKHDTTLANQMMRTIQDEFEEKMYISIKFQT